MHHLHALVWDKNLSDRFRTGGGEKGGNVVRVGA